jgi:hypothetical protein
LALIDFSGSVRVTILSSNFSNITVTSTNKAAVVHGLNSPSNSEDVLFVLGSRFDKITSTGSNPWGVIAYKSSASRTTTIRRSFFSNLNFPQAKGCVANLESVPNATVVEVEGLIEMH